MTGRVADPSQWFLAERRNPGCKLSIYTSGNDVTALIDGAEYFAKARQVICGAEQGDAICYAGWRLDHGQELAPGDPTSRIEQVLAGAHRRGVSVRVLLSNHLTQKNARIQRWLRTAGVPCMRDSLHPRFGSSHQKLLIAIHEGTASAFCGGIDIAHRRWDQTGHAWGGWHDVQCYVRGPASLDLFRTFQERWNDPRLSGYLKDWAPLGEGPPLAAPRVGTHHVQVLRTYACNAGYPFAPKGEFTARRASLKAIKNAQRYVYMEDQYFISREIAGALAWALRARPNLRVIVVVPEAPSILLTPFVSQQRMLIGELKVGAGDRFAIYHLKNASPTHWGDQIYVHSKLMIVDDIWAEIGSVNCNRRSLTYDAEAAVAVIDDTIEGEGCKFARDLRLNLWAEHLALDPGDPSIQDPREGFSTWRDRAGLGHVPAVDHETPMAPAGRGLDFVWRSLYRLTGDLVDPCGLCPEEPIKPA